MHDSNIRCPKPDVIFLLHCCLCKATCVFGVTDGSSILHKLEFGTLLASLMCHLEHFLHGQQLFSGFSNGFTPTCLHTVNLLPV